MGLLLIRSYVRDKTLRPPSIYYQDSTVASLQPSFGRGVDFKKKPEPNPGHCLPLIVPQSRRAQKILFRCSNQASQENACCISQSGRDPAYKQS